MNSTITLKISNLGSWVFEDMEAQRLAYLFTFAI